MQFRRWPRAETSLPARYFRDGQPAGRGVITSLGAGGCFVRTLDSIPVGTEIWLEAVLGPDGEHLRTRAKVVNHDAKRKAVRVAGMGLEFVGLRPELTTTIARFARDHPGAVEVEPRGEITWPFGDDPSPIAFREALPLRLVEPGSKPREPRGE